MSVCTNCGLMWQFVPWIIIKLLWLGFLCVIPSTPAEKKKKNKNSFLDVQGKHSQSVFHPASNPSKLTNSKVKSENIPECSPVICRSFSTSPLSPDFIDEVGPHYLLLPYLKQTNQLLSCSLSMCQLLNPIMLELQPEEPLQTNWAPRRSREEASEGFHHHTPWTIEPSDKQPIEIMSLFFLF